MALLYPLDILNVLSLPALRPLGHLEVHTLPFLQAAKAASLNSGEMHEDILPSLTADEAVTFSVVKLSRLSWKWRKRSSVKIAERTYEKRAQALHC
jgi:hypothetical protein